MYFQNDDEELLLIITTSHSPFEKRALCSLRLFFFKCVGIIQLALTITTYLAVFTNINLRRLNIVFMYHLPLQ